MQNDDDDKQGNTPDSQVNFFKSTRNTQNPEHNFLTHRVVQQMETIQVVLHIRSE